MNVSPDPRGTGTVGFLRFSVWFGCPVPKRLMREEAGGGSGATHESSPTLSWEVGSEAQAGSGLFLLHPVKGQEAGL